MIHPDDDKPWRVNIRHRGRYIGFRAYDTEAEAIAEAETRTKALGVLGLSYTVAERPAPEE